jgi:hypothetical protein
MDRVGSLYFACESGDEERVKLLLQTGANIEDRNFHGNGPRETSWGWRDSSDVCSPDHVCFLLFFSFVLRYVIVGWMDTTPYCLFCRSSWCGFTVTRIRGECFIPKSGQIMISQFS